LLLALSKCQFHDHERERERERDASQGYTIYFSEHNWNIVHEVPLSSNAEVLPVKFEDTHLLADHAVNAEGHQKFVQKIIQKALQIMP
jgi:hypothetical protein